MDLNFITVPLSFYLFRLADAFEKMVQDISQNPDELVKVKATPKPAIFSEKTIQTENSKDPMDLWEKQKAYSDSGEILEIHFLHSFSQIIQEFL